MRKCILATTLLLAACSQTTEEPSLNGYWVTIDDVYDCVNLVRLRKDKTYSFATSCILENGSEAIEIINGTYTETNDELTFLPKEGSCPTTNGTFTLSYHFVTNDQLALQNTTGGGVYDRVNVEDFKSGSHVTYGCYLEDGTFVPSPVQAY